MTTAMLHPVRSIVTATDLSASAGRAVEQAALLARRWGAALSLLHVFDDSAWASIRSIYEGEHWSETEPVLAARNQLSQLGRVLVERYALPVHVETRAGQPASEIAAFATDRQAQLIVVGEHGQGWLDDDIVGGTAMKVLGQSGVPVLLARCPPVATLSSVLIATDFSDNAKRAARQVLDWFPDSSHTLLHAYQVAFEGRMRLAGAMSSDIDRYRSNERERAEAVMKEQLAELGMNKPITRVLMGRSPAIAVVEEADRLNVDLIALGRNGSLSLAERLLGSTSEGILRQARCDILMVP